MGHLKRALVTAQYHKPRGIFYGGRKLQRSHVLLWNFLERYANAPAITWIDVHTGPGKRGEDTLLLKRDAEAQVRKLLPNSKIEAKGGDGEVSAEYDLTRGMVGDMYPHRFHADTDSLIITQEFG